ncbi:MAG: redox-sensing transcriptional repressor Rex [Treponema sp.]|nr:redox-sensing transcriptional repressor Rex [Candidatus Treponema equifaecale]
MKEIPAPSKKRLVLLAQILSQRTKEKITSVEIQRLAGWSEATVRRDISLLELHNGVSNGYDVKVLRDAILARFNMEENVQNEHRCCIVGLGKLGEALLESSFFEKSNFKIVAGFDSSQNRIELLRSRIPLHSTNNLESFVRMENIEYAVLSVDDAKAQLMADKLVAAGIKGIVNYTNTVLSVPDSVKIENVNPVLVMRTFLA